MASTTNYPFAVYNTQCGGLVLWVNGSYVFVEKPDVQGLYVGDIMPSEWVIGGPANDAAKQAEQANIQRREDQREFDAGIDTLFNNLDDLVTRKKISGEEALSFFPKETTTW